MPDRASPSAFADPPVDNAQQAIVPDDRLAGPIRGELLGADQLAERARTVARSTRIREGRRGFWRPAPLLQRLMDTREILERAHKRLTEASERTEVGPAGDWFLDNWHVVQEHIREVRSLLPGSYYRELPELTHGPLAGYPRAYEIAITIISHTEGRVDLDNTHTVVGAYQEVSALRIGELWALPAMLRLALIENVRRMTLRTVHRLEEVERADHVANHLLSAAENSSEALGEALVEFLDSKMPLTAVFAARFLQRLRLSPAAFAPLGWLEQWMADEGMPGEQAASISTNRLAITQVMMANSITSLRSIARMDWRKFVERQSVMEAELRKDPSGYHDRMTFQTRDHYRHVVERIAMRTKTDEAVVARLVVELAAAHAALDGSEALKAHVGYWLVDRGLPELERRTRYRPKVRETLHRLVLRHPNALYFGGVILATIGALLALLELGGREAWGAWLPVVLFGLIPASDIAISVVNRLVVAFLPPRILPKLDVSDGVPVEFSTAVVIPTLFGSVEAVNEMLETIEVQFLANREAHLHFAILSDFTDADSETKPDDDAVLAAAVHGVTALNDRYAPGTRDAFYLFHRPRKWNAAQGVWMGWERKRGKLSEFNHYVRGGARDAFTTIVGAIEALRGIRYVITLDSDTRLPPDSAPLLIGTLAHPLNRAVYDPSRGRVVRGYGILQPRVGVSLPSAQSSYFARLMSGQPGVDPYTTAVSDVYQDLYGEGSFTGKGIYDLDAFEQATRGRFPENRLLSHDLIEGNYARAGLVTDVNVYDDYPAQYLTHTSRKHRWLRGDWQLLQWLTPRVPGPDGSEPNRLGALSRWKIFDNMRRSVVEVALLLFLAAGWWVFPGSALRWTVLAFLALASPWIISVLIAVLRPPLDKSWRPYYAGVARDAMNSVYQVAIAITFLPHQAWISLDGIIRTLHRLFVTKRVLLEWQTASQLERHMKRDSGAWKRPWLKMWPVAVLAAASLVLVPRSTGEYELIPLFVLWMASPFLAHALGAAIRRREWDMPDDARLTAMRYAGLHWHFYDQFVTERTHWLAPDNFQEDPTPVVAMRTSPTNIGLQLLATVSAYDLGFIAVEDMLTRLERAMRTLERMRRYRGHFFNWYDLHDLRVLEPPYISTVDSGNFAGHLIALRQALLEIRRARNDSSLDARLTVIADRATDYAREMDFTFLYDEKRELFSIGYQQSSHQLDPSFYDLLASEARLASFIAIARNDVPVDHWFHLGRTLTRASGDTALVSWSGSMFEYLMPTLVMETFPLTLLDQTMRSAVRRQIAYGKDHGVPWGTSESAYNIRDRQLTYQYRAFGVPDLALERRIGQDLVVAPYATALALGVDPQRAMKNLQDLEAAGALGLYGFYDALDFTRPEPGSRFAIVRNYMAHHVGMSLVALTNALANDVWPRRFHNDPLVRSAELLLHERIPRKLVFHEARETDVEEALPDPSLERPVVRAVDGVDTPRPHIALLGRLPYTIMISHAGGGYSRYRDLAVTRWRADATADNTGQFCYVKDVTDGHVWSTTHQPTCEQGEWYHAFLATDRVTYHRRDFGIETRTEVAVVPDDAAEVRRVTLINDTDVTRELELTSYGEVVINSAGADRQHPAFSNLFVETEWHQWCTALTATRRPRSAKEKRQWCVHVVDAGGPERVGAPSYETDRAHFLGRGRTPRMPLALDVAEELTRTTGAVLDPIFAIRVRVRLEPGQSASVAFTTLVAESAKRAFALADRYHDTNTAQRALDLAWTATQVELRELGVSPADASVFQELAGHLFYALPELRAPEAEVRANTGSQPLLWSHGISGDWPILMARIKDDDGIATITQLFAAHHYWRRRGMMVDMVVLNEQPSGYLQLLNDKITAALFASGDSSVLERPGGVFIRRRDQLADADALMLRATARVIVDCDGRSLAQVAQTWRGQMEQDEPAPPPLRSRASSQQADLSEEVHHVRSASPRRAAPAPRITLSVAARDGSSVTDQPHTTELLFDNGTGGLTRHGDYDIRVQGDHMPPAPWANVIANARGGFLVTERGAGCTWVANAQFFRLTPWHNDPVSDPPSDAIYLRDEDTGDLWSPTPGPVPSVVPFRIRHGAGSSIFAHHYAGIESHLTIGMAPEHPVRLSILRLTNHDRRRRRISATAYVEWALGAQREHTQHQVITAFDEAHQAHIAWNNFNPTFAHMRAFAAMTEPLRGHTGDRREFLGRNGWLGRPAVLADLGEQLSGVTSAVLDPCSALQCEVVLAPGETRELVMVLGAADSDDEARQFLQEYRDVERAKKAVAAALDGWAQRLAVIRVKTPEPSFDAMINRWMLYQALACRMWGRAGVYQSSGAFGFRDQLQDTMAFVYAEPAIARQHIIRAAGRQFPEGDVQHWWHPPDGRGVRTKFSDDLAWLPLVVEHYVRVTGDASVLDELAGFITMPLLTAEHHELYDLPQPSPAEPASIYDHCVLALKRACTTGSRGLPLMGIGDWNDGMSRVGVDGRGESVWLAWFLTTTLRRFAPIAESRGDMATATTMRSQADAYAAAVDANAWDGEWYRRAYFDDGTALGAADNKECRIDSIAQSWSVISGAGDPERQRRAMQSLETHLVLEDERMLLLLVPPFDKTPMDPGYIKGYLPGVRENGAQYTHAALWAVQATALLGDGDRAFELYQMINPLTHASDAKGVEKYKVEPYVIAADVYTAQGQLGRGGWTWYTGSASWMYRVGLEDILGFRKRGNTLRIEPRVPGAWKEYSIEYRFGGSVYAITVSQNGEPSVTLDGRALDGGEIALLDDGKRHEVVVVTAPSAVATR